MNRISNKHIIAATVLSMLSLSWVGSGAQAVPLSRHAHCGPEAAEDKVRSSANSQPIEVQVGASTEFVNIMGKAMPAIPPMPSLALKPNVVRGYVRDAKGRPLKGA